MYVHMMIQQVTHLHHNLRLAWTIVYFIIISPLHFRRKYKGPIGIGIEHYLKYDVRALYSIKSTMIFFCEVKSVFQMRYESFIARLALKWNRSVI